MCNQNYDVEFFRKDNNEEILVLKTDITAPSAKDSIPVDDIQSHECSEGDKYKIWDLLMKHGDVFIANHLDIPLQLSTQLN